MTDLTFETLLTSQLREYAEAGVRPIDRYAIAEETIAGGRTMPRWRRGWGVAPTRGNRVLIPLLVGLLLAALTGGAVLVGSRLMAPKTPPHSYANELVSAPDLSMPMARPALVPLLDGRVLVIGDDGDGGGATTRALVYDPATGTSEAAGPLASSGSLWVEAAVRLTDGRVLVIGNAVAQVFDPGTMRFTPAGPMITPRSMAGVVALPDGRALIAGGIPSGQDAATNSAELFDPRTPLTFSPTGSMTTTRSMPSMAVLPDGRVFVSPGESRTTVEIYDPSTGTFSAAGTMSSYGFGDAIALRRWPGRRHRGHVGYRDEASWKCGTRRRSRSRRNVTLPESVSDSATLLDDGRILLVGGRTGELVGHLRSGDRRRPSTQATRAWQPKATRLADGRVLIVGGLTDGDIRPEGGGTSAPGVSTVEIFQ